MSRYAAGARFERQVKADLEAQGWFAVRAAGSHGPVDVVAAHTGALALVQCKTNRRLSPADREQLAALETQTGGTAVLASRPRPGVIAYEMLEGQPWTP